MALLDNSPQKQDKLIDDIKVLSPAEGIKLSYDVIVILSFYVKSMKEQLLELGVSEDKIYHFYNLRSLLCTETCKRKVRYYGNVETAVTQRMDQRKRILLLSHDLTLGGPSIALFHAASLLKKEGYEVVYASMLDGPLRQKLLSCGMKVIVDENLMLHTMKETPWIEGFSLVICNTINFHVFLSEKSEDIPVMWWLHDSRFFYDGVERETLKKICWSNLRAYSVGAVPRRAFQEFLPQVPADTLIYGVKDVCSDPKKEKHTDGKVMFVTIGYIEERKGQDILVRAIRQMPDEVKKKACFYMVGQDSSVVAQKIKEETGQMPEVFLTGTVDRDRINEILNRADVLICPSREDPMPTVAAEAMMHHVPCIVSDATGTAGYITNGVDGFTFRSEDTNELAERIKWCIENREKLYDIGVRSRKIYDKYFSMDVFEKNLLDIVDGML